MEQFNQSDNDTKNKNDPADSKIKPKDADQDFPVITEDIENASKYTTAYIKKHYLPYVFIFVVLLICIIVFFPNGMPKTISFWLVLGIGFIAFNIIKKRIRHAFMQQFALANNYKYQEKGSITGIEAPFLQMGRNRHIGDVVSGVYKECPLRLFNFNCTIGSGKSQRQVSFTVCEIQYKTNLQRIFLLGYNLSFMYSPHGEEKVSLEGDFNKYFSLYVPKGYEIEALEIFTPDVMAMLIDKSRAFSLEFIENHLYIYAAKPIDTKSGLYSLFELARILIVELAPVLERLK